MSSKPLKNKTMKIEAYNLETKEDEEIDVSIHYTVTYDNLYLARTFIKQEERPEIEQIVINKVKHITFGSFIFRGTTFEAQIAYFVDSENKIGLTPYLLDAGLSGYTAPIEYGLSHFLFDYEEHRQLNSYIGMEPMSFSNYIAKYDETDGMMFSFYKMKNEKSGDYEFLNRTQYKKRQN